MQPGEFLLRRRPFLRSGHHVFQFVLNDGYRLLDGAHGAGLELVDAFNTGDSHLYKGLIGMKERGTKHSFSLLIQFGRLFYHIGLLPVYTCHKGARACLTATDEILIRIRHLAGFLP